MNISEHTIPQKYSIKYYNFFYLQFDCIVFNKLKGTVIRIMFQCRMQINRVQFLQDFC